MYVKLQQLTVSLCMLALLRFQYPKSFLLQLQYRVTDRDSEREGAVVAIVCKCRIEFPNSHSIVWVYIYTHKQTIGRIILIIFQILQKQKKKKKRILIISSSGMYSVFSRSSVLDYSILLLLLSY